MKIVFLLNKRSYSFLFIERITAFLTNTHAPHMFKSLIISYVSYICRRSDDLVPFKTNQNIIKAFPHMM